MEKWVGCTDDMEELVLGRYAKHFDAIHEALHVNAELRHRVEMLVGNEPMIGKAVEGENRLSVFRGILLDLVSGRIGIEQACRRTGDELPQSDSRYRHSSVIFSQDWRKRLVHAELSRFYNQAVIELLLAEGYAECLVLHSDIEDPNSRCTRELAGGRHSLSILHSRLVQCYRNNDRSDQEPKVPDHPYCTHTVVPLH
jgi:hypothetical protein